MSSLRERRAPSREGFDSLGDRHYPGVGAAAKGAIINPALQPGDWPGYIYDWEYTWPSGGGAGTQRPANGSATAFGLTLTCAGLANNAGTITATGSVDAAVQILVLMAQDSAAGEFNIGGIVSVAQGTSLADVATAVSGMLAGLDNLLSSPSGAVVDFNLQSAGVIEKCIIAIGTAPGSAGGPTPGPIPEPGLPPGGVDGPNTATHGDTFWISRSGGQGTLWYYWIDVDNVPGPDTKRLLTEFLEDENLSSEYRGEIAIHAIALGWDG